MAQATAPIPDSTHKTDMPTALCNVRFQNPTLTKTKKPPEGGFTIQT